MFPLPARARPWSALSSRACADPICTRPAGTTPLSRCRTGRAMRSSGSSKPWGPAPERAHQDSGSSWSPTCPAGRARCAPPDARTCARTCSSSAAAIRRAVWRTTSPSPRAACIPCRASWTITPRRSSSRCPRRCTRCAWRARSAAGPSPSSAPGPSACSPSRCSVRTEPAESSAPTPIPPSAHGPRPWVPMPSSTPDPGRRRAGQAGARRQRRHCVRLRRYPVVGGPGHRHG